ncbi:MAG: DUF3037 domain-containing protein [Janthinobacterium lividum]
MGERVRCEFSLIRYVPDPVKGEFANIGIVLRESGTAGTATVRFTRDWSRVRCLDPGVDLEMLEALEAELAQRLRTETVETTEPVMVVLEDSLSNSLQITTSQGTLAESLPAEMELLLRMYVEPLKAPAVRRRETGRTAIAGRMRDTFERAGVWGLMRKRVPAREYTEPGDPLRLDCGYRDGQVRLFHAVSLESDTETAKGLAFSLPGLQRGVTRVEGVPLELTAVVESMATVADPELYRFGVGLMEKAGVRVFTVADLGRVAETARRELRV